MTVVAMIAVKLSNTARRRILLGSLSYEPRGNLSVFTSMHYRAESVTRQENSRFREAISSRNLSVLSGILCPRILSIFFNYGLLLSKLLKPLRNQAKNSAL